ncbi:MAG: hypothetical protein V4618_06855 [Pseudomonadota bacterium]
MPPTRKLKVFRTAIGFHDAYIAVPSKKAALDAWGSDRNLFAIGAAESVEDGALADKARSVPGKVIKVARGTTDQHLAALPKDVKKPRASPAKEPQTAVRPRISRPRPSRRALEKANAALEKAERARADELERLDQQIAALTDARRAKREAHDERIANLRDKITDAQNRYDSEMATWSQDDG